MKNLLKILPLFFIGLISCQNEITEIPEPEILSADLENLSGVERDIMINILSTKFGGYKKGQPKTRALNSFSLTPFVEDGDTLLYVAQYSDGWEIYSANHLTNMILFSSEKGRFDINDPNMSDELKALILANAHAIKDLPKDSSLIADKSWGTLEMTEEDLINGKITVKSKQTRRAIRYTQVPPGQWVLIDREVISTKNYISPKLISTEWNQNSPWNLYSKLVKDKSNNLVHAKAGCTPIAVSQYLYYTHYKDGVPSSTVTTATLTADGKDYVFSGNSSSIWDSMEKTWTYLPPKQTAIFIGYIGRCLDADYGSDATEVYETKSPVYLQQVFGVQFPRVSFDYQYVKKSIDKGYPVVAGARTNKKEDGTSILNSGHAFLIDQYKQTTEIVKYVYGLIRDPWNPKDGEDPWDDNDYDDEGNIIGWAYTNEIEQTQSDSSISMNWGYLEHENHVFYYPYSQEWNAGGYIYNLSHTILKRADIE